eukprot:89950-Chlamydomonas_euryale.AAC.2
MGICALHAPHATPTHTSLKTAPACDRLHLRAASPAVPAPHWTRHSSRSWQVCTGVLGSCAVALHVPLVSTACASRDRRVCLSGAPHAPLGSTVCVYREHRTCRSGAPPVPLRERLFSPPPAGHAALQPHTRRFVLHGP